MSHVKERYAMPGIALSGYGGDEDIRQGRAAGFAGHLVGLDPPTLFLYALGWGIGCDWERFDDSVALFGTDCMVQTGHQLLGVVGFGQDYIYAKRPEFRFAGFRSIPRACDDFHLMVDLF